MYYPDFWARVEDALRDLTARLHQDCEAARRRGEEADDIKHYYWVRWWRTAELADEIHDMRPDVITATETQLHKARELTGQLEQLLAAMRPASDRRRRVRPDLHLVVLPHFEEMADGRHGGPPRYGQRLEHGALVDDPDERQVIAMMIDWRDHEGLSLRQIVDRLEAQHIPARRGRWHPQTVARVLDNTERRAAS